MDPLKGSLGPWVSLDCILRITTLGIQQKNLLRIYCISHHKINSSLPPRYLRSVSFHYFQPNLTDISRLSVVLLSPYYLITLLDDIFSKCNNYCLWSSFEILSYVYCIVRLLHCWSSLTYIISYFVDVSCPCYWFLRAVTYFTYSNQHMYQSCGP